MRQVCVHTDQDCAARLIEPSDDSARQSALAAPDDQANRQVHAHRNDNLFGAIARIIVHHDDLVRKTGGGSVCSMKSMSRSGNARRRRNGRVLRKRRSGFVAGASL